VGEEHFDFLAQFARDGVIDGLGNVACNIS